MHSPLHRMAAELEAKRFALEERERLLNRRELALNEFEKALLEREQGLRQRESLVSNGSVSQPAETAGPKTGAQRSLFMNRPTESSAAVQKPPRIDKVLTETVVTETEPEKASGIDESNPGRASQLRMMFEKRGSSTVDARSRSIGKGVTRTQSRENLQPSFGDKTFATANVQATQAQTSTDKVAQHTPATRDPSACAQTSSLFRNSSGPPKQCSLFGGSKRSTSCDSPIKQDTTKNATLDAKASSCTAPSKLFEIKQRTVSDSSPEPAHNVIRKSPTDLESETPSCAASSGLFGQQKRSLFRNSQGPAEHFTQGPPKEGTLGSKTASCRASLSPFEKKKNSLFASTQGTTKHVLQDSPQEADMESEVTMRTASSSVSTDTSDTKRSGGLFGGKITASSSMANITDGTSGGVQEIAARGLKEALQNTKVSNHASATPKLDTQPNCKSTETLFKGSSAALPTEASQEKGKSLFGSTRPSGSALFMGSNLASTSCGQKALHQNDTATQSSMSDVSTSKDFRTQTVCAKQEPSGPTENDESAEPRPPVDCSNPGSANQLRARFEQSSVRQEPPTRKSWAPKMSQVQLPDGQGTANVHSRGSDGGLYNKKSHFVAPPPKKKSLADLP